MTEHTPGPWAVGGKNVPPTTVSDSRGRHVCSTGGYQDGKPETLNENKANASLIARAPELLAENEALKKRIAELEAAQEWKPIETAPEDREILVCGAGKMWFARWNTDFEHWEGYFTHEPTHWIPLPKMEDE